jgi:hypothetical protein
MGMLDVGPEVSVQPAAIKLEFTQEQHRTWVCLTRESWAL